MRCSGFSGGRGIALDGVTSAGAPPIATGAFISSSVD